MAANLPTIQTGVPVGDARLLIEAFETFTQASSSLEGAFGQLEARVRQLSDELEAKNDELERSLRAKHQVESYLKSVLESLPLGVVALDEAGRVTLCNPSAAEILGWPKRGPARAARRETQGAALSGYFADWRENPRTPGEVEITIPNENGSRVLAASGTRLTAVDGASEGSLHILRDVTEVKLLQEQSKRGERLSAMGEMAVELAHEIRNPLGSIELFASLLEGELPRESDGRRWAENIRIGSRSLDNIVSNMLHFASPLTPSFDDLDLHELLEEITRFTEPIMRQRGVTLDQSLAAVAPQLRGDRELLKQMLLNLILNAMQAMPTQGRLEVSTASLDAPPGGVVSPSVELRVRDTGLGIPAENLDRIFDPFFTTNKNGTGLGLSVVHQIVQRHSGSIRVESEVGAGTTFTVVLPRMDAA